MKSQLLPPWWVLLLPTSICATMGGMAVWASLPRWIACWCFVSALIMLMVASGIRRSPPQN